MNYRMARKCAMGGGLLLASLSVVLWAGAKARPAPQAARGGAQVPAAPTPEAEAPLDLTGYWVSVVTEDWRWRMIVADKGDFASLPLNPEGVKVGNAWDPAKDKAAGEQCKAFGAAGLMRIPGRLHISWENDKTLRVDTDSGTQTRLFHFDATAPASEAPSWQGYSVASWEGLRPRRGFGGLPTGPSAGPKEGYLKVETTHLRAGYLRTNGVPYSANTSLLEYYDSFREPNGDVWLVITTIVTDPQYLFQPFITSTHFKKLSDSSGWDPTSCRVDVPR